MAHCPNTNDGQAKELITKSELAKKLRVTARTIDNWTSQGIIERIKIGRVSRYDWAEVISQLKSKQQAA